MPFKRERRVANDFLQIRKVMEYIYENIISPGNPSTAGAGGNAGSTSDSGLLAEQHLELLCNDHVLDPNSDLRTVSHYIWKSNEDLVLNFKLI